jgi:hypothetical protein
VYSSLKQPQRRIGRIVSLTVVKFTLTAECSVLVLAPSPTRVPRNALTKTTNVKDNATVDIPIRCYHHRRIAEELRAHKCDGLFVRQMVNVGEGTNFVIRVADLSLDYFASCRGQADAQKRHPFLVACVPSLAPQGGACAPRARIFFAAFALFFAILIS